MSGEVIAAVNIVFPDDVIAQQGYVRDVAKMLGDAIANDVDIIPKRPDAQGIFDAWHDMMTQVGAYLAKEPGVLADNLAIHGEGQGLITQLTTYWYPRLQGFGLKLPPLDKPPIPTLSTDQPVFQEFTTGLGLGVIVIGGLAILYFTRDR